MSDLNQKILEKIIKENQFNNKCADCDTKFARWASVNLGIFLCQNCASIHRGLGTHISYIKSVNLDEWTLDMIENMKKNGNEKINKLYEGNLNIKKPDLNSDLEERRNFIEKKYRDKKFYSDLNFINQSLIINENNIKNDKVNKVNKDIDLLSFEIKNDKELNDLFNFSNKNNIEHFDDIEVNNKINKINDIMNQQQIYQQQLYQQQLYQQQLYQQQLYQQQLYQQQLYQQQMLQNKKN